MNRVKYCYTRKSHLGKFAIAVVHTSSHCIFTVLHVSVFVIFSWSGLFLAAAAAFVLTKRQLRDLIYQSTALLDTAWDTAVARRHIQARIPREEVSGPQQQRHWLRRHHGEVFRGREVRDAECVPEDNISVNDVGVGVCSDPKGKTL